MNPLLDQGKLPNISRLMSESSYGTLLSLEGYISPALWATIDTGKIPKKHGVLDFYGDSRHHVQASRVFDILGGDTGKIGLLGWYSTYPPQPNQGFTIPSPMAPGADTFPERWSFVKKLRHVNSMKDYLGIGTKLLANGGHVSSLLSAARAAAYRKALGPRHPAAYYRQLFAEARINTDVFARLIRDHKPDFAAILFYYIDAIEHRFWKYMEPDAFAGVDAAQARKYRRVIPQAYILADKLVGRILKRVPAQATVVVVSDHGQMADPEEQKGTGYRPRSEVLKELGLYEDVYATILNWKMTLRLVPGRERLTLERVGELFENTVVKESGLPLYKVWPPGDGALRVGLRLDHIDATSGMIANTPVLLGNGRVVALKEVVDLSSGEAYERMSGAHAINGIFIIRGENVKRNFASPDANLVDIVPTLLALHQKPIGQDMDGQVVEKIFEKGFLQANPVSYIDSYDVHLGEQEQVSEALVEEERQELEDRLRALGYL